MAFVAQRDQNRISWPFGCCPEQAAAEGLANFLENWCRGRESNPHVLFRTQDFKSCASASFATPAWGIYVILARST